MTTPTTPTTRRTDRPTTRTTLDEESTDAPLVPFIADPTGDDDEIRSLRRDITALRAQLDRIESHLEDER